MAVVVVNPNRRSRWRYAGVFAVSLIVNAAICIVISPVAPFDNLFYAVTGHFNHVYWMGLLVQPLAISLLVGAVFRVWSQSQPVGWLVVASTAIVSGAISFLLIGLLLGLASSS